MVKFFNVLERTCADVDTSSSLWTVLVYYAPELGDVNEYDKMLDFAAYYGNERLSNR